MTKEYLKLVVAGVFFHLSGHLAVGKTLALQSPYARNMPNRHTRMHRSPTMAAIMPGQVLSAYASALSNRPLVTKALTSGVIFTASDLAAQKIESPGLKRFDQTRALTSLAIGGVYFGPAAHYWYAWVTEFIVGNSLKHVLAKAALGQLIFGPIFTCLFFAVACVQSGAGIRALPQKIRSDLMPAQIAGCCYWPFVDLISFSLIPVPWIPLFINGASFIWTIYLSLMTRKGLKATNNAS